MPQVVPSPPAALHFRTQIHLTLSGANSVKRTLLLLVGAVCFAGCGKSDLPELGEVSGVVTLDGAPLADAIITFTPSGAGRPSTARTDEDGHYELLYLADAPGALVGSHTVTITPVITEEMEEYDPHEPNSGGVPPPVYPKNANDGSIVKEVSAGDNEIDITLVSDE